MIDFTTFKFLFSFILMLPIISIIFFYTIILMFIITNFLTLLSAWAAANLATGAKNSMGFFGLKP